MYGPININTIRAEDYRRSQLPNRPLQSQTREAIAVQKLLDTGAGRHPEGWYWLGEFLGNDAISAAEKIA